MELARLQRLALTRWRALLLVVIAGVLVASVTTVLRNGSIQSEFDATASWVFEQDPLDINGEQLTTELLAAQIRALDATEEVLATIPGGAIAVDEELGQLEFSATAFTEATALSEASRLRESFIRAEEARAESGYEAELAAIVSLITELELEIGDLTTLSDEEVQNAQEIVDLRSQIDDLTRQLNDLRVELVTPTEERTAEFIEAEIAAVEGQIGLLKLQLDLVPRPDAAQEIADQIRVRALERQVQGLEDQYGEIFLRQAGLGDNGRPGPIVAEDITPARFSVVGSGVLGGLLGLMVGLGAVVLADRVKPAVWMASDVVTVPVLGSVPERRESAGRSVWYLDAAPGLRKASVQRLRSSIEGRISDQRVSVAVGTFGMNASQTAGLVADVAASFTVVGKTALLVDLGAANDSDVYEFDASPVSIRQLLAEENPLNLVSTQASLSDGLFAVRAGDDALDADEVAGPAFRDTFHRMVNTSDVTFVTPGEASAALAQVAYQITDYVMLAVRAGTVPILEVEALAADLRERGIAVLGLVLYGTSSMVRTAAPPQAATARSRGTVPSVGAVRHASSAEQHLELLVSQMRELEHGQAPSRPEPGVAASEFETPRETDQAGPPVEVRRIGHSEVRAGVEHAAFVDEVLDALRQYPADRTLDYVEAFLEDRVVGYMTSRHLRNSQSDHRADAFALFIEAQGIESVAEVLASGLRDELGPESADRLLDEFDGLISSSGVAAGLDDWLENRFFRRHVITTHGAPRIWHLRSRAGHAQLLVDWYRLDKQTIDTIRVVLERQLIARITDVFPPDVAAEASEDIGELSIALGWLYEGTTPEARIWYPWLTPDEQPHGWEPDFRHGVKAHLAPFQRLGLLAVDVLKLNDLVSFSRSA